MRLLVGDDTGLMKSIEVSEVSTIDEEGGSTKSASVSSRWGQQGRDERVSAAVCGDKNARPEPEQEAHTPAERRNFSTLLVCLSQACLGSKSSAF